MPRTTAVTTTCTNITGLGRSPQCQHHNPEARHPYQDGKPMTDIPPDVARFEEDGVERQVCLDCLAADESAETIDAFRATIVANPMMQLTVCKASRTV